MKALTKRLEDRYQSAAAMRSDIERYLAGRPVEAAVPAAAPETAATAVVPPVPSARCPPAPVAPRPLPEEDEYDEPPRSRAGLWVLLVLLVVGLIAGGVLPVAAAVRARAGAGPGARHGRHEGGQGPRPARRRGTDGRAGHVAARRHRPGRPGASSRTRAPTSSSTPAPRSTLVISEGKPEVAVPPVVGPAAAMRATELRNAGFDVVPVEEESDEDKGKVHPHRARRRRPWPPTAAR